MKQVHFEKSLSQPHIDSISKTESEKIPTRVNNHFFNKYK